MSPGAPPVSSTSSMTSVIFPGRRVAGPPFVLGVLPGEGIGPEVIEAALRVLAALGGSPGMPQVSLRHSTESTGHEGMTAAEDAFFADLFAEGGAVLCGPRGGRFVYELRRRFDLYLKLSPLCVTPARARLSLLATGAVSGADVLVVRDNAGGVYQGEGGEEWDADGGRIATHSFTDREGDVRRILQAATTAAELRQGRLAVVGKGGGVPTVTRLWRDLADEVCRPRGLAWEMVNFDLAAYRLIQEPRSFDVLACPNLEGDVLADVGAVLLGARGLSFSGNFTPAGLGVFQTNHGAAADLAGRGVANPLGQIASLAMLLRESFGLAAEAAAIEGAIESVLAAGCRTADLAGEGRALGTREMTDRVIDALAP
jgi:3-isopropylmalate dehydrogenase